MYWKPEVVRLLLKRGAKVDVLDPEDFTTHYLMLKGLIESSKDTESSIAIDVGSLNIGDSEGQILKHQNLGKRKRAVNDPDKASSDSASQKGHTEAITPLNYGITPLHKAADTGDLGLVKKLLVDDKDADVNAKTQFGGTPLHFAAFNGNCRVAQYLLKKNAEKEALDGKLFTPLLLAAQRGHYDMADLLVRKGAQVNVRCQSNETPLDFAIQNKQLKLVGLLLYKGANIDSTQILSIRDMLSVDLIEVDGLLSVLNTLIKPDVLKENLDAIKNLYQILEGKKDLYSTLYRASKEFKKSLNALKDAINDFDNSMQRDSELLTMARASEEMDMARDDESWVSYKQSYNFPMNKVNASQVSADIIGGNSDMNVCDDWAS